MDNQPQRPLNQESPPANDVEAPTMSPEQAREQITQAIEGSNEVLAAATTAFQIFSDTLTIDRAKLTVTKRAFWKTAEVMSIRIEDVLNVTATVGPIFGSVKITSRVFNTDKPYVIDRFWRDDALRLKRITQGYVIALQRGIDCSSLPASELAHMLDSLGEDNHA